MKKFSAIFLIMLCAYFVFTPAQGFAASTTLTFAVNRQGRMVRTQDAFLPDLNITTLHLVNPENMVFDRYDRLFIADTGNRRVVVFCTNTHIIVDEIRYSGFTTPRGVFVTPNMMLYVADTNAESIFMFDLAGDTSEPVKTITQPMAMEVGEIPLRPIRIAVDNRGSMYIVGEAVAEGIIHLSNQGEFLGFFTSNMTTLTFTQLIQNVFMSERQLSQLPDRIPLVFSNITVDTRGVVYTTSMGTFEALQGMALRRHNMAGRNTITNPTVFTTRAGGRAVTGLIDVTVDRFGNIFVADTSGYIEVYTNYGELIFRFGSGTSGPTAYNIAGWFADLHSVAVSSVGEVWALDRGRGIVQSFAPTNYTMAIFESLYLFNQGLYEEAGLMWNEVLRRNQMSVMAHTGLGRAYFYQQNYDMAMHHFFLAGNREYYSVAFWETRNDWLLNNLGIVIGVTLAVFLASFVIKHLDRKQVVHGNLNKLGLWLIGLTVFRPIVFALQVARHPIDSFYYMKLGQKGSMGGAIFHAVLCFIAYMFFQTSRGFLVQFTDITEMDFTVIIGGFIGVYALFIFSNYLVTSIKDGEGGLSDIFKMVSYSLFPTTLTLFAVTVLSHLVTENELFLLTFLMIAGFSYSVIIAWLGLQEIHNYSFRANLKSMGITTCFMIIAIVVMFNMLILSSEILEFVLGLGREVYVNVSGLY